MVKETKESTITIILSVQFWETPKQATVKELLHSVHFCEGFTPMAMAEDTLKAPGPLSVMERMMFL
jgi:hypothetical protein